MRHIIVLIFVLASLSSYSQLGLKGGCEDDLNTPSRICLDLDALRTNIGTGVNSTVVVSQWNNGANFPITEGYYNISLDPTQAGIEGTVIDPAEGQTVDVYLVGFASSAVTGAPNTNTQMSGIHWELTRTNGELEFTQIASVISTGYTPAQYSTTSYNDLASGGAQVRDGDIFLNGAGFDVIKSSKGGVALLQLDGNYLLQDSTILTVDQAVSDGYAACEAPEWIKEQCYEFELPQVNLAGTGPGARGGVTIASLGAAPHQSYTATEDIILNQFSGTLFGTVTVNWSTPNHSGSSTFTNVNQGGLITPFNDILLRQGETLDIWFTAANSGHGPYYNVGNTFFTPPLSNGGGWEGTFSYTPLGKETVRTYDDNSLAIVDTINNDTIRIDNIPNDWVQVSCDEEHKCVCEKLDYTVEGEVQSSINEIRTVTLLDHTYLRSTAASGVTLNPATAVGSTASTTAVEFYTPEGLIIPAKVTVERIQAGTSFMSIGSTGGGGMGGGASDFIVTVEILPDDFGNVYDSALMAVRPAGVNGGGANESLVFDQGSAIIDYSRGPNGTNITTFPYTGVFNNNNNNSSSALGFEAGHIISFRKVNTNPWTASVPIVLKNPPQLLDIECCDLIDSLRQNLQPVLIEGFGIRIQGDTISTDSTEISQQLQATIEERFCSISNASIDVQNINDNGIITWTQNVTQGSWVDNGDNTFTYIGTPDWVEINVQLHQEIPQNANRQRPAPLLILEKSTDGGATWSEIAISASGYIRDFSDHEESSNSIFYRDFNSGTDPTYRIVSEQEALAGIVNSTLGQFDLEACEN